VSDAGHVWRAKTLRADKPIASLTCGQFDGPATTRCNDMSGVRRQTCPARARPPGRVMHHASFSPRVSLPKTPATIPPTAMTIATNVSDQVVLPVASFKFPKM